MIELHRLDDAINRFAETTDKMADRLDRQGDRLDELSHKVSFVKCATWVIGGLLALLVVVITWYFTGKLNVSIKA